MMTSSYPKLFSLTLIVLGCIFGFFTWQYEIDRETFLRPLTIRNMLLSSLLLAVPLLFAMIKWGTGAKPHTAKDYIKLYSGVVLLLCMVSYFLLTTLTWLLPGQISTYSTPYEYDSAGRHSCSGARLYDPDLEEKIKVCYPAGNVYGGNVITITKRSNALGMTVIHAVTKR
ncbi:hypothetical protein [Pantoea sp. AS-PWVM4]|uniref:hypothetical protein n=1 Tax=Pantoea sp. AS-PWVM4 TaxID=1332069 RepID=UPI00056B0324|nr:hypothetical protein [Pantoea sp. AS-PWVM4]